MPPLKATSDSSLIWKNCNNPGPVDSKYNMKIGSLFQKKIEKEKMKEKSTYFFCNLMNLLYSPLQLNSPFANFQKIGVAVS